MIKKNNQNGFSLIEAVFYVAILGIVAISLIGFLSDVFFAYNKVQAKKAVLNNISTVLEVVSNDIRYAKTVYTPTSNFGSVDGQLSLESEISPPTDHSKGFIDFYKDNGIIYKRTDGSAPLPITSNRVFVTELRFDRFISSLGKDTIKTTIKGKINIASSDPQYNFSTSLTSTSALRGGY